MNANRCTGRFARTGRATAVLIAAVAGSLPGQVIMDGTLGPPGSLAGPNFEITTELGRTRGDNLFHSFSRFDLRPNETATFSGPANIQNILGRVTGGHRSSIDGTIRSEITGANLFLINPHGLLFGPNSAVQVSGAFAASSADYLRLSDGARFLATLGADDSTLSTAPVVAFGFLRPPTGAVTAGGSVEVAPATSLSLVGGAVTVGSGVTLEALDGTITLKSVSTAGEVSFSPDLPNASDATLPSAPGTAGSVVIRGGRLVVDGDAALISPDTGGEVDIAMSDSVVVIDGGRIVTRGSGTTSGGDIQIKAVSVAIDGHDRLDLRNGTRIAAETSGNNALARGGDIRIEAGEVTMAGGAEISVSTSGAGDAGRLQLTASSLVMRGSAVSRFPTQISANAASLFGSSSGRGGEISIDAQTVSIRDGAGILASTRGPADAGMVRLNTESLTLENGAITTFTAGPGRGGQIDIVSDRLLLNGPFASISAFTTGQDGQAPAGNGGVINIEVGGRMVLRQDAGISANTFGDGDGGNITISADELVLDTATFAAGSLPGISAASNPSGFGSDGSDGGEGGNISIFANSLLLQEGMTVSSTTATSGSGGAIHIAVVNLTLESGASIQSASTATGQAGRITLASGQDVVLSGGSTISTSAPRSSGGDIDITAGNAIQLFSQSKVTAEAGPGGGGNISVNAPNLIYLLDSAFDAQAGGNGGNLAIDPVFFVLNRSELISKSSSANGGNITISSEYFFQSASTIDASAPFGLPGEIRVTAPDVNLSGVLVGLPGGLLNVEALLQPDCAVRLTGDFSSFVILGRGGLPVAPGGFVPSRLFLSPEDDE